MLWELRFRRDQFSIESGRAKGRPDPEWLLDCPELLAGEWMYMRSFWELNTERPSGGGTFGPIPRSKIMEYGREEYGFDRDTLSIFWPIMSAMDAGFLGWQRNEHDRYVRQHSKKGKKGRRTDRQTYNR